MNVEWLPRSRVQSGGTEWGLARTAEGLRLVVRAPRGAGFPAGLSGEVGECEGGTQLVGPANARNAVALRAVFPWLVPTALGTRTSAGFGDRLGMATPGHIRALRAAGAGIAPIFAQQSIREMARTGRTPQQVMDAATWGMFEEGWRHGAGADADHLKETEDIDRCAAVGFTQFTIDPGAFVDATAGTQSASGLAAALESLPWDSLEDSITGLRARYLGRTFKLDDLIVTFDEHALAVAAVKYGRAVVHVVMMYRHVVAAMAGRHFDIEVSVDETDEPTSHAEHVYVATELRRLGVRWAGLAPRFVGRFEKGVDYIGDHAEFERHFAGHASIARALGPYKLSLHSGSDKFGIYGIAAAQARGLLHLKTAGTSYLEALRSIAEADAGFFRKVYAFARERYEADRASYHVSASLDEAPTASEMADPDLPALLDQFDARQILHVTFGSVLTTRSADGQLRFAPRLVALLERHPESYAAHLERHFARHLAPIAAAAGRVST